MCGVFGYVGATDAQSLLLDGLRCLEYRGYDSAGIVVHDGQSLGFTKTVGRLANLAEKLDQKPLVGTCGMGHTRWATHGEPSWVNAHPQWDVERQFAVIHNGVLENEDFLRGELQKDGYKLVSSTDTEVIAHMLARDWDGHLLTTVCKVAGQLTGAYAFAVMASQAPQRIVAVRWRSPLIVGLGDGEQWLASDIPALLPHTRKMHVLEEGEVADLTAAGVQLKRLHDQTIIVRVPRIVTWQAKMVEREGHPNFMHKELLEQPTAIRSTLQDRLWARDVQLAEELPPPFLNGDFAHIHIIGCGTAYHAGLYGRALLERWLRIPCQSSIASEYQDPLIQPDTCLIAVSQSGETADVLSAVRLAKERGVHVLAITNVRESSLAHTANAALITHAGPEIAVASTKAYTAQLVAFLLLALAWQRDKQDPAAVKLMEGLHRLPVHMEEVIGTATRTMGKWAQHLLEAKHAFFLGRGLDVFLATEGALKLKELSYIHAESYPAGELKHGSLALVEEGLPVVALFTQPHLQTKMLTNLREATTRGAHAFAIVSPAEETNLAGIERVAKSTFQLPPTHPWLAPLIGTVPLQWLAYHTCLLLGHDVDKPRNLAKSVTVE